MTVRAIPIKVFSKKSGTDNFSVPLFICNAADGGHKPALEMQSANRTDTDGQFAQLFPLVAVHLVIFLYKERRKQ